MMTRPGQNTDGSFELFLFDTTTNIVTQLTNSPDSFSDTNSPAISATGTRIVFDSDADLTSQNADGNDEIFLFDTNTMTVTQLTSSSVANSFVPDINADGTRIAFASRANLTDQNSDGNLEIFLLDTTTNTFTQLTNYLGEGTASSSRPAINADGTRIAFDSDADLTGQNADGNSEVFLFDTTTNTLTQLTTSMERFERSGDPTAINADGTRIAFNADADLTGQNADGNDELFLFDTTTDSLTQLTQQPQTALSRDGLAITSDGARIVFESSSDLTGQNADRSDEIFLADCSATSPQGVLENPQPASFQSGIGVISGWICSANVVEIEFDGGVRFEAAYGTSRADTAEVCGDTNNGFSLLFNWNLLGDGKHTVRVLADGDEVASVPVTVTTLGLGEFPTGLSGMFTLVDFPAAGDETDIQWQQSQQNFVIVSGSANGSGSSGSDGRVLENPQPGSFQSGVGVISGFVCDATVIEIEFNGTSTFEAAYGTSRGDTQGICGDTNNGFSLLFNWNLLGDGLHTVRP